MPIWAELSSLFFALFAALLSRVTANFVYSFYEAKAFGINNKKKMKLAGIGPNLGLFLRSLSRHSNFIYSQGFAKKKCKQLGPRENLAKIGTIPSLLITFGLTLELGLRVLLILIERSQARIERFFFENFSKIPRVMKTLKTHFLVVGNFHWAANKQTVQIPQTALSYK